MGKSVKLQKIGSFTVKQPLIKTLNDIYENHPLKCRIEILTNDERSLILYTLTSVYIVSILSSLHFQSAGKEHLVNNRLLLQLLIISFLLVTTMFDSGVRLWGENSRILFTFRVQRVTDDSNLTQKNKQGKTNHWLNCAFSFHLVPEVQVFPTNLVQLADSSEHSLTHFTTKRSFALSCIHTDNVLC